VIDFRYHLVSIVGIFLALAVGIVLGTTALNGPVTKGLQRSLTSLSGDANSLRARNAALQRQLNGADSFAHDVAPSVLRHRLDGQRVVLISAPGAASQVEHGIATMLIDAGAAISGRIQLQNKFFGTSTTTLSYIDQLSQDVKPAGVTLVNGTPQQHAAQVLAWAVATSAAPAVEDLGGQAVMAGFAGGGILSASGKPAQRATLAVVITPAYPVTGPGAARANQALIAVAAAMSAVSLAAVMAGPASSTGPGGAIAALRISPSGNKVSSVDDADSRFGQITVALALASQMTVHEPGSYGTGPGATRVGPSPMPAAPNASASPTAATRASTQPGR
jgi:Copper transport outer membrane protein, MctB